MTAGGYCRPHTMANWNGAGLVYVRNCLAARTAATSGAGPPTHPTFHPVKENVFPPEEMVRVRSAIPGSVASGTWAPSKNRCS